MQQPVKRLIKFFTPSRYDLHIKQNSQNLEFSGSVKITGSINKLPVTLHSSELIINTVTVNGQTCTYSLDEQSQELFIDTQVTGEVEIAVQFAGKITKPMHGLYPCYFAHDGIDKRLLATQFESHHAREVFPCVDEPEAKATFQLHLTTFSSDVVVSNTPIQNVKKVEDGFNTTTFEVTPKMSTYLLAWVSGELIYEEALSKHGIVVRTYATPVHTGKLSYSVEVACKAMDYMDDYFDIPYPLKKFDQVALPDFAAGAMENWGCVTFRESALLYDPEQSDISDKQHIADVVIHELSHQWFGNLVTMRWWEDLWLNEGFASWIPYLVRDALYPEWNIWEHFATSDLMIGLRADALENTHPIVVPINSPEEIRSAFDSISYDKGCSVINLLYNYIGKQAFQEGLRIYLKKHAYDNAETKDLWSAWSESSGRDVIGFMKCWTEDSGFPIIHLDSDAEQSHLSQERFFINPAKRDNSQLWPIPLMRSATDTEVMTTKNYTVAGHKKLNSGQSGFYRTIYSGPIMDKLTLQISSGETSAVDTLGLINDSAEAAKAGYHSTVGVLELLMKVKNSTNDALVGTVLTEMADIRTVLSDTFDPQKPILASFIQPNLIRLGIDLKTTDTIDDQLLRPSILSSASLCGNKEIIEWALNEFKSAKAPEDLRSDIRGVVYQTAVRELNDVHCYEKLLQWYHDTTIPGERTSIGVALTSFKSNQLFKRSLSMIATDAVKLQDSMTWVACSLLNRHNKQMAWQWIQDNWGWVAKNFSKEKEIDYYLRFCSRGFATEEHLRQYTEFFGSVDIFGSQRAYEQGKETIAWQSAWKSRDTQAVLDWLEDFKG